MSGSILTNYEASKLSIDYPTITNIVILGLLLLISLLWTRKQSTTFLDKDQTDQLRGGSILLVIMTHLWQHVSTVVATPDLGGYGVSIFLLISGFALTSTLGRKTFTWGRFLYRRLRRMMIPYWLLTVVWLFADYVLLQRTYSLLDITYTFAGLNFNTLSHIDYVRWYITWIIMWYVAFAVANRFLSRFGAMFCIFGFGFLLLILRIMRLVPLVGHPIHMLAFPFGMLLATYRTNVTDWLSGRDNRMVVIFGAGALLLLGSGLVLLDLDKAGTSRVVFQTFSSGAQIGWTIVFVTAIFGLGRYGYLSRFLQSWGKISYGAFLIHGPLLIKYNPIMNLFPSYAVVVSFLLFLVMVWVLAYLLHAFLDRMWEWLDGLSKSSEQTRLIATSGFAVTPVVERESPAEAVR